jgi:hypothetical protein
MIGPTYYGVVLTENFGVRGPGAGSTGVTITESVTTYVATTNVSEQDSPLLTTTVYPNPANDVLIIQITTPLMTSANVELVDLAGRTAQQATIHQGSTMCFMDVQTVYAGAYIVRVTHQNNSVSYPVVIGE